MNNSIILLGSNIGDRNKNLHDARKLISELIGKIEKASKVYETEPWGNTHQDKYLNQALLIQSRLLPREILELSLSIEKTLGRQREIKWEPRIIDIDIIFYNSEIIHEHDLYIPHPLFKERLFALEPVSEIVPEYIHPEIKKSVIDIYKECLQLNS